MSNYAVMRLQKLKSLSAFAGIEQHDRERQKLRHRANPDLEKYNKHVLPKMYSQEQSLIDRFHDRVSGKKIRSNAVYGFEVVLSFSPEMTSRIDIATWLRANAEWLSASFGGASNILDISLHMDEKTPHLHAVICPIDEYGKLNAKRFTGSRSQLSKLQDTYAESMKKFGLERGVRYYERSEKVYHQNHKQFRAKEQQQHNKALRSHSVLLDQHSKSEISR